MSARGEAARRTVLVVDDDFDVRDALGDVLRDAGYDVVSASNGREALAVMQRGPRPDVVLLDLMMPVMDGYAFRAAQRADPELASVPVVVLTADRHVHERRAELDPAACLTKPTRVQDLLDALADAV